MTSFTQLAKKLTKKDSSGKVMTWGYDIGAGWGTFLASDMAYMSGAQLLQGRGQVDHE